ncbi:MAG: tetratricopeptide repeat protein [Bacteroidetes bacterium]|nr:tetratricopeptide repeat protein [Bacteroidota bacterium]
MAKTNTKKSTPSFQWQLPALPYDTKLFFGLMITVFALAFALYANSISNEFVLDDAAAVQGNKLVQKGPSAIPELMKTSFFYGHLGRNDGTYRPTALVSFAIEKGIWGNNPHAFHFMNVLFFALTVALLFYVLVQLFGREKLLPAFVITLLYAAHPIHTEVVANIKSRDEIYCFLFALLSLNFALRYNKIPFLILSGICFLISALSKESALPFLIIIPLTIWFFKDIELKKLIPVSATLVLITVGYLGIRYALFHSITGITINVAKLDNILFNAPFSAKFPTAVGILGKYLWLLIKPFPLSFDYSFNQIPFIGFSDIGFIIPFLIFAGALVYAVYSFNKKSIAAFAILFFVLSISVVSNIVLQIGSAMAERFLYIPSLGFCILVGFGICYLVGLAKNHLNSGLNNPILWIIIIPIMVSFGFITINRNADWKTKMTLYSKDVISAPKSARTHYSLGTALYDEAGTIKEKEKKMPLLDEAETQLSQAIEIDRTYAEAVYELGLVYHEKGEYNKEMELLGSLNSMKNDGRLTYTQGNALLEKGDVNGAKAKFYESIKIEPKYVAAYVNLASIYNQKKMYDSAIYLLKKAEQLDPKLHEIYINLGMAYADKGNTNEAFRYYAKANEMKPTYAGYTNLANAYNTSKRFAEAEAAYNKASTLEPTRTEALFQLSVMLLQNNKYPQALGVIEKIVKIEPANDQAITNIGYCKMKTSRTPEQYRDALFYYKKGFSLNPNNGNARNGIVTCFLKLKMKDSAVYYSKVGK